MRNLLDPKNQTARWELIKGALRARGSSLSAVARDLGLSREAVHHVRRHPYPAVETAIAGVLGVPARSLWPERYREDGAPKRKRTSAPTENLRIRRSAKADVRTKSLQEASEAH